MLSWKCVSCSTQAKEMFSAMLCKQNVLLVMLIKRFCQFNVKNLLECTFFCPSPPTPTFRSAFIYNQMPSGYLLSPPIALTTYIQLQSKLLNLFCKFTSKICKRTLYVFSPNSIHNYIFNNNYSLKIIQPVE